MKKTREVLVALILLLALCLGLFAYGASRPWFSEPRKIFLDNQEQLETVVDRYLTDGVLEYPELKRVIAVNEWTEGKTILEFIVDGFGIAPASTYRGFYYSVDGGPAAFQGMDELLVPNDDGWWDWRGEGDNSGRTKPIGDGWYVFEAHC